eukprot:TRINITY_DN2283_c0_g1_i1.p1 TRINITY_DN2283_c0_g1~~TRINITY_DN2283_c0_g1_i1.p1  ORF type:complete len:136 (-),score=23.10 TRINITY_DN2283_c0_g1_i1:364-771(-)
MCIRDSINAEYGNFLEFFNETCVDMSNKITNIHLHIPAKESKIHSERDFFAQVQGTYEYYHYLHDQFDDRGWGCAYRSCQTLSSWFCLLEAERRVGHAVTSPPTVLEQQKVLVELGDKASKFLNSKNWIGSCEIF